MVQTDFPTGAPGPVPAPGTMPPPIIPTPPIGLNPPSAAPPTTNPLACLGGAQATPGLQSPIVQRIWNGAHWIDVAYNPDGSGGTIIAVDGVCQSNPYNPIGGISGYLIPPLQIDPVLRSSPGTFDDTDQGWYAPLVPGALGDVIW